MKYSESGLGDFGRDLSSLAGCLGSLFVIFIYLFVVGVIVSWLCNFILIVAHADFRVEWYQGAVVFVILKILSKL